MSNATPVNEKNLDTFVNLIQTQGPLTIDRVSRKLLVSKTWASRMGKTAVELGLITVKIFKTNTFRVGVRVYASNETSEEKMLSYLEESAKDRPIDRGQVWE